MKFNKLYFAEPIKQDNLHGLHCNGAM